MKVRAAILLVAWFAVPAAVLLADARTDEWIAKARAALGSEKALDGIQSVHYTGTLESIQKVPSKDDPAKTVDQPFRVGIDIVFQKPYRQRIMLRSDKDKAVITTALDDYDAWIRRAEVGKEDNWQLTLLDPSQIKRLRADTWENLSFYRGIESRGGRVEYRGEAEADGRSCVVLAFLHSDDISFTRYFEKSTGRLIKTVTENGSELRESGEILAGGIHYPKTLVKKTPDGQVTTITFDRIEVNEPLPAADFAVPELPPP